jgi:sugar/nucleoside kinase (ribokinase family)
VLCTLGDLVEDVVVWLNTELNIGSDTESIIRRTRGGSAANVAMFASLTGTPSRFIGQVGHDRLGTHLCEVLRDSGVDVQVISDGRTGSIVVLVQPNGQRSFLTDRGVASHLAHFDAALMNDVHILHVPTYSLTDEPLASTSAQYIASARSNGSLISVDASSASVLTKYGIQRFQALMQTMQPDVFLCNEDEAATLGLHANNPMIGAQVTVIKQGPLPVIVVHQDGTSQMHPVPAVDNIVDTTGAGDAFAAGFLPAYASSRNIVAAVSQGHALASRVLQCPGATLNPSLQQEQL